MMLLLEINSSSPRHKIRYLLKVGLSPSKKNVFFCFHENILKMMQNVFLFHLKRSFRSEDI